MKGKKILSVILTMAILVSVSFAVGMIGATPASAVSAKLDLSYLFPGEDASRLTLVDGDAGVHNATRMQNWDNANNILTVSNSVNSTDIGGMGKGYLIDGHTRQCGWPLGLDGLFLTSATPGGSETVNETVTLNLQNPHKLTGVKLYSMMQDPNGGACFPKDFTISVSSDGSTWQTVVTKTGYIPASSISMFDFDVVQAQYVRLAVTKVGGGNILGAGDTYALALAEMEIFEDPDAVISSSGESGSSSEAGSSSSEAGSSSSEAGSSSSAPSNLPYPILANGKIDLSGALGGRSDNTDMPGWDENNDVITTNKSFECGWANGYGKGFLIDNKASSGAWPVDVGQFLAITSVGETVTDSARDKSADIDQWIQVNLKAPYLVTGFGFSGLYTDAAAVMSGLPNDFKVEVSKDGTNWTTVLTKTGWTATEGIDHNFSFDPVEAQYVRFTATKLSGKTGDNGIWDYAMILTEIAIYAGTTPATGAHNNMAAYAVALIALAAALSAVVLIINRKKVSA